MDRSGVGVGSASIVLIFAALCLTVFTLISYMSARNEKALTDMSVRIVTSYYEADTLAEFILAEILESNEIPEVAFGIEIFHGWDWDLDAETVSFICPITDTSELYAVIALYGSHHEILSWRIRHIGEWEADNLIPVWPGLDDEVNSGVWTGAW
jgi:hypothetical protein